MKIKTKLIIGFSLIFVLFMGITSFGYERLNQMNQSMEHFYDNRFEKVRIAYSIRGEVNASVRIIDDIVLGEQDPADGLVGITTRITNAAQKYKLLSSMDLEPSEQEFVNGILKNSEGYVQALKSFAALVNKGDINEAKKLYSETLRQEQENVIESLDELVEFQEAALKQEMSASKEMYNWSVQFVAILTLIGLLFGLGIALWVFPSITKGLNLLSRMADRFGKGRLRGFSLFEIKSTDELGDLAKVFKKIALDLQAKNEREAALSNIQKRQARINSQIARVTELIQQGTDVKLVAQLFISEFSPVLGASYGVLYMTNPFSGGRRMELSGSYATLDEHEGGVHGAPATIGPGEGLLGQCIMDSQPIIMNELPHGYVRVGSGLGEIHPKALIIQPIMHENAVIGVLELASVSKFSSENIELLEFLCEKLGTIVNNIFSRQRVEELLRESQAMTEELQAQSEELSCQQEELRETNDKLEGQRNELKNSELQLQQQQEELEHTNQELTVKTTALEEYINRMEQQNSQIAKANSELERQALQLAMTSKYKSEFLANMSHELRTPLNSLLILSEFLAENKEGNLTDKQREYMRTIQYSGHDLLKMIDEILDLSKIDAGKMDIHPEWMVLNDVSTFLNHMYAPMVSQKNLSLSIEIEADIPNVIWTDGHRLKQILRNLMSNAIKFTDNGSITLTMRRPAVEEQKSIGWTKDISYIAFSVLDSGIGIPPDKKELIFEAFHQADGTTSRKFGGTGLGLTISKELARLLGGWIHLETELGKGSIFTLVLPERIQDNVNHLVDTIEPFRSDWAAVSSEAMLGLESTSSQYNQDAENSESEKSVDQHENRPNDDRDSLSEEDKVLLIVEDDVNFAKVMLEMAHSRGFKAIVAIRGDEGLELAKSLKPHAIILDIQLPVMDGWSVLNELKSSPDTRHIPVHVVSVMEQTGQGLKMGAIDYLQKPANGDQLGQVFANISSALESKPKKLLLIEQNKEMRQSLTDLIVYDDVIVTAVSDSEQGWSKLKEEHFDCIVLDSNLPGDTGIEFLERIQKSIEWSKTPIILHGSDEDDGLTLRKIRKLADSIVIKDVKSPERLLEETALFLHRVEADLPEDKRKLLNKLHNKNTPFENKIILLVDDDIRNVFALSSVLEHRGMTVIYAENGMEALNKLEEEPDIDLVLMDIMMPEMDGYEAMSRIRQRDNWRNLPIIALTAKAMKDDRNKCIEAGASDYITKPVNSEQLLSLMRVWLYR